MRVTCLTLAALLLTTLAATLSGSPVAAQTATPIVPVPTNQGLSGSWVSPAGYAFVAFNEGTGQASRLVAIRPADGGKQFSVDLPGVVWDVTFDADGNAFAAVNNTDGNDQGWVYKISLEGGIVERRDLAPHVWPNQIEFGADGRVYVTTWPDSGNGALIALNASSLAVENAVPLSEVGQLHARSSGLVLIVAGLVRFFSYADIGKSTSVPSHPVGITFSSVTPEGTAYTLWFENSVDGSRCSAGTVFYAAPDGTSRQISTDPLFADFGGDGCQLADLEALPGGGAAIVAVAGSLSRIVWIDARGQQAQRPAERDFDAPLEARLTDLRVDGTGIVTLATTVSGPCPAGEFEGSPCAAVELVGYDSGAAVAYTTTIDADQTNARADDDSVQLNSGAIGPERVFVGAGFVVLAGGFGSHYCGPGCGPGGPAWLFAQAPVSKRTWEDPATGSTSPPPSGASVQVSPLLGVVGTTFTAKYDCSASPNVTIVRDDGQPATDVSLGLPVTGDGSHYAQSFQLNTAGSHVVVVHCGANELRSPAINVTDRPRFCKDAALIGVRGSGNNQFGDSYPGHHAAWIADILQRRWGIRLYDRDARGFGAIGLTYPAVPPWELTNYGRSVDSGAGRLGTELDGIRADCGPTYPILLAGFSQGAHVIQSTLESLDDAANQRGDDRWRSIAGVALLASPRFDPNDPAARGTFAATYPNAGLAGRAALPSRFGSRARSYCVARDPVCAAPEPRVRVSVHLGAYDEGSETGQPILEDAAGLLAHGVRALKGGTATPAPTGDLAAYDLKKIHTVLLSGAAIYARGAPTLSFGWDLNDDRVIDRTTSGPVTVLPYRGTVPRRQITVSVRLADGSEVARCIRLSPSSSATC